MTLESNKTIKASPTKDLFITMLIRDLTLRDAIGDLVDNSVDGAKTMRNDVFKDSKPLAPSNIFKGLEINIIANESEFCIKDNCGGISVSTAREYAFRFGRPKDSPNSPNSVGQFGIGMKRALFKLGNNFSIKSVAESSKFSMDVDVREWQKDEDNWDFMFSDYEEGTLNNEANRNTVISVTDLSNDVKEQFKDGTFISKLREEIGLEHLYNINKGLIIRINGTKLKTRSLDIIRDANFKASKWQESFKDGMQVTLIAGISKAETEDGGWYVFCNDRLIVGPEQTELTGWTGKGGDGGPHYHSQFNRFRGYAFFEAEDSSILPWNTTKNGMDRDSPRYKQVRRQMIELMKPIMTLLNKVKSERERDNTIRPYQEMLEGASIVPISNIDDKDFGERFTFKTIEIQKSPKANMTKITYSVNSSHLDELKKALAVKRAEDVGKLTFKYYYESEIGSYNE